MEISERHIEALRKFLSKDTGFDEAPINWAIENVTDSIIYIIRLHSGEIIMDDDAFETALYDLTRVIDELKTLKYGSYEK
jgi:hypothetical protein